MRFNEFTTKEQRLAMWELMAKRVWAAVRLNSELEFADIARAVMSTKPEKSILKPENEKVLPKFEANVRVLRGIKRRAPKQPLHFKKLGHSQRAPVSRRKAQTGVGFDAVHDLGMIKAAAKSHPLKGAPKALPTSAYRLIDPSAQLGKEWEQSPLEVSKDSALVSR